MSPDRSLYTYLVEGSHTAMTAIADPVELFSVKEWAAAARLSVPRIHQLLVKYGAQPAANLGGRFYLFTREEIEHVMEQHATAARRRMVARLERAKATRTAA